MVKGDCKSGSKLNKGIEKGKTQKVLWPGDFLLVNLSNSVGAFAEYATCFCSLRLHQKVPHLF